MRTDLFASFEHRNYRLFFTGQVVSVTGTWLQMTAMPWLIYRVSGSALLLGLVGFLSQAFILVLSPFAGTLADHYDKKRLLLLTQGAAMVQALLLAALTLTGTIRVGHILVLSSLLGIINAFDMPARQAFVLELVPKENLMNAIGLNSTIFNGARLVGPAVAGVLIAAFGEGVCFLFNGLSFIAVLGALALIVPTNRAPAGNEIPLKEKFMSGIAYIRRSPHISAILLLLSITGMVGTFPMILMPVFVKDIYHLGPSGLGLFMSAMGVGAIVGTLRIAGRKDIAGMERAIYLASLVFGILMIAFSFVHTVALTVALLAVIGYFVVQQMGLSNSLIQLSVPDEMRGRVMGFYIMAFMGFAPLGSLLAGFLAHALSAPATVGIGGAISCVAALTLRGRILKND